MKIHSYLTVLVVFILTTGCQTRSTAPALRLGSLFPVTGDSSSIGRNLPKAVELAVNTINACGGVNKKQVELTEADTKTDRNAGVAGMSKLVTQDQVSGVIGAWSSDVSSATIEIAVRNQVMQISPGSTSPVFTERAKAGEFDGYWARTVPPDTDQAQALAQLAIDRGFDRVATVVINNSYGVGFEKEFIRSFKDLGGTVINENNPVRYDPNPSSFDEEVVATFANDPDAVLAVLYGNTGASFVRAAHDRGSMENVTLLLTDSVYSPDFVNDVGSKENDESLLSGALGTIPGATGQGLEEFTAKWQETEGEPVTAFTAHSWDAAILMMLAAELGGQNTGTAIKENLRQVANAPGIEVSDPCEAIKRVREGEEINYQGASGDIEFDRYGDTIGSYDVWQVEKQGEIEIIDRVTLSRN
ncbi:UNVERIFIED_CONTAM: amino acid ABC transporter substrate-binding protein [Euhalothece sp. KZN 001]